MPLHMTQPLSGFEAESRIPRIVCLSTHADATDMLVATVELIMPGSRVDAADPAILRDAPNAECVIVAVGTAVVEAESLVRDLRARGYANALLVVADAPQMLSKRGLELLGVARTIPTADLAECLPGHLADVLSSQERMQQSEGGRELLASLRRLQQVVAAGQLARQLQHRINNPLAALLAEAQLLELESLAPDHALSVRRMVELCRRIIEETRSIEGLTGRGDQLPGLELGLGAG